MDRNNNTDRPSSSNINYQITHRLRVSSSKRLATARKARRVPFPVWSAGVGAEPESWKLPFSGCKNCVPPGI
jgi:hypothetical protein